LLDFLFISSVSLNSGPTSFEDDPNSLWDSKSVAETLNVYIEKLKIDSVSISGIN
jgi:hypothetical protein